MSIFKDVGSLRFVVVTYRTLMVKLIVRQYTLILEIGLKLGSVLRLFVWVNSET